jgi:RNA polymerase-binding transcription factor DksA
MNKRELARFQKLIEEERRKVMENLGMIEDEVKGLAAAQTGNQSYSNHMADAGSDAMETEQAFIHASQGSDYLLELNAALIEKGRRG